MEGDWGGRDHSMLDRSRPRARWHRWPIVVCVCVCVCVSETHPNQRRWLSSEKDQWSCMSIVQQHHGKVYPWFPLAEEAIKTSGMQIRILTRGFISVCRSERITPPRRSYPGSAAQAETEEVISGSHMLRLCTAALPRCSPLLPRAPSLVLP